MFATDETKKSWIGPALAGPALAGAILGLREGPRAVAVLAVGLPAVIAAVTALTAPTLYVGSALVGTRLSSAQAVAATRNALAALGIALGGLAPLALFLGATSWLASSGQRGGLVLLGMALAVAFHRLRAELGPAARTGAASAFFAGYTVVAVTIGVHLFGQVLAFAGRAS